MGVRMYTVHHSMQDHSLPDITETLPETGHAFPDITETLPQTSGVTVDVSVDLDMSYSVNS